jgi:hypothetical protein
MKYNASSIDITKGNILTRRPNGKQDKWRSSVLHNTVWYFEFTMSELIQLVQQNT